MVLVRWPVPQRGPGQPPERIPTSARMPLQHLQSADLAAEAGFPLPRPVRAETTPPGLGRFTVPHWMGFNQIVNYASRSYRWQHDEALRHSRENTLAVRRDPVVMDALRTRQIACAQLGWHLDVEDDRDQELVQAAQGLEDLLRTMPRWQDFVRNLLEAIFYGRYANQVAWGWQWKGGQKKLVVRDHRPVNGDKLVMKYDGRVGILVHQAFPGSWEYTDRGRAHFFTPEERECLILHRYEPEDADFYEAELAGGIHGKGIRDRIYWFWLLKNQVLGFLMDYLERVGAGGFLIYFYEAGNVESENEVREIAEKQDRNLAILFPRYRGEPENSGPGVQHIQPSNSGANLLAQLVTDYFDNVIRRYILGQSLTSEAHATGLGSGIADLHADTFARIVKYDATTLAETITEELLAVLQRYNYPHVRGKIWFRFDTDRPNAAELLEAAKVFWEMGGTVAEDEIRDLIGLGEPSPDEPILSQMGPLSPMAPGLVPQGMPMMGPPGPPGMDPMAAQGAMPMQRRGRRVRYAEGDNPTTGHDLSSQRILPAYDPEDASQWTPGAHGRIDRAVASLTQHPHPQINMLAQALRAGHLDAYYPLVDALEEFGQTKNDLDLRRELLNASSSLSSKMWSSSTFDALDEQYRRLQQQLPRYQDAGKRGLVHNQAHFEQIHKGLPPARGRGLELRPPHYWVDNVWFAHDEPPFEPKPDDTWAKWPQKRQMARQLPVDPRIQAHQQSYLRQAGLPLVTPPDYGQVDPAFARQVASFYQQAPHQPQDPATAAAYRALAEETLRQYLHTQAQGVHFEPWRQPGQPYADSRQMAEDARRGHLSFYTGGQFPPDHPLAALSGLSHQGQPLSYNDLFRAVHDYYGHALHGNQFGPRGEEFAYRLHGQMYSPQAQPALAAETRGQNSWVNFGPHSHLPVTERPYAEQKATTLPPDLRRHYAARRDAQGRVVPTGQPGRYVSGLPERNLPQEVPTIGRRNLENPFQYLTTHADPVVQHLATQVLGGTTDAYYPLLDRLLDIGDYDNHYRTLEGGGASLRLALAGHLDNERYEQMSREFLKGLPARNTPMSGLYGPPKTSAQDRPLTIEND